MRTRAGDHQPHESHTKRERLQRPIERCASQRAGESRRPEHGRGCKQRPDDAPASGRVGQARLGVITVPVAPSRHGGSGHIGQRRSVRDPFAWTPSERCPGKFWGSSTNRDDTPWGSRVGGRLHNVSTTGDDPRPRRSDPVHACRLANSRVVRRLGPEPLRHQPLTKRWRAGFCAFVRGVVMSVLIMRP